MEHEERFYLMMMDALDGELDETGQTEWQAHLRACPDCSRQWRTMMTIDMLFRQTPMLRPALDFTERTLARLPDPRARRLALGAIYTILLLSGLFPLVIVLFFFARYAPILRQPEVLGGVWASITGVGRAAATIIEALLAGAGRFVIEQPVLIGWFIILAGLVFLWGGVFQRLLAQPATAVSRK